MDDYAELMREIFDLRQEIMNLKAQIKNDDEYLEFLSRQVERDWSRCIEERRRATQTYHPEIFR